MNIDHINIAAPLEMLEKVRDFYCEALGLEEGFRPSFSQNGFWLYAEDKPLVHLSESAEHHAYEKQGYLDHIAFQSSGLESTAKKFETLGIEYRYSHIPDIKLSQLFVKDPAGNRLELNFPGEAF